MLTRFRTSTIPILKNSLKAVVFNFNVKRVVLSIGWKAYGTVPVPVLVKNIKYRYRKDTGTVLNLQRVEWCRFWSSIRDADSAKKPRFGQIQIPNTANEVNTGTQLSVNKASGKNLLSSLFKYSRKYIMFLYKRMRESCEWILSYIVDYENASLCRIEASG
jgi:hypothetical protein